MAVQSKSQIVTFTGGERDSYEMARIDRDDHASSAERMENVFIVEQGAMELAPGSIYLRNTPADGAAIVRRWAFSMDVAFGLEFSDGLIRFIADDEYGALDGAAATVGTFSDQSSVTPAGGDPPPSGTGGGGDGGGEPPNPFCIWIAYDGGGGYWYCPPGSGEFP